MYCIAVIGFLAVAVSALKVPYITGTTPPAIDCPNDLCYGKYDGNYELRNNPNYFVQCVSGLAYCQPCFPLHLVFVGRCNQCLYNRNDQCATTERWYPATTYYCPDECPKKGYEFTGNINDPNQPKQYVACWKGVTVGCIACPYGLEFNMQWNACLYEGKYKTARHALEHSSSGRTSSGSSYSNSGSRGNNAGSSSSYGNQGSQGSYSNRGSQGGRGSSSYGNNAGSSSRYGNQGSQGSYGNRGSQGGQGSSSYGNNAGSSSSYGNQGSQGSYGNRGSQGRQGSSSYGNNAGSSSSYGNQGSQGSYGNTGSQGGYAPGTSGGAHKQSNAW